MWHNFFSDNLGVGALSYAHAHIIKEVLDSSGVQVRFVVFGHIHEKHDDKEVMLKEYFDCEIYHVKYGAKEIAKLNKEALKEIKKCNYLFDIGEGDSFSDIYGIKRLINQTLTKVVGKFLCGKLVLAPQTFGPFKSKTARILARIVSRCSDEIYSRDLLSKEHYQTLTSKNIKSFTDVAFALPFNKIDSKNETARIGINVSGLLYSKSELNKEINLNLNYKDLINKIVSYFLELGATVEIISHVSGKLKEEDDYFAALNVKKTYPEVIVVEKFKSPIEAKTYISGLDFFVGARMHATIAALSSGVPVVPIAYSMKFKGVFSALGYNWVSEANENKNQNEIFDDVISGFDKRDILKKDTELAINLANLKIEEYKTELRGYFSE